MSAATSETLHFPVLFPGLDAANHDHNTKVDWTFSPDSFTVALAPAGESHGVEAGEEVFNNYGPKPNAELLIGYGFCLPSNPHDTVALTLKPPPISLQKELLHTHSSYFSPSSGEWDGKKTTFNLHLPTTTAQTRSGLKSRPQIFQHLPPPLLELLTHILRHERGLPFQPRQQQPLEYLTSPESTGRRYLPHIARMIVSSLAPKAQTLRSSRPTSEPANSRQEFAAMYQDGQVRIIDAVVAGLKAYIRALVFRSPSVGIVVPTGPTLLPLPTFLTLMRHHNVLDTEEFLAGVSAAAGSGDPSVLRAAGWEEDLWVLLLSYILLRPTVLPVWLRGALGEYIALESNNTTASSDVSGVGDGEELHDAAAGVLDVVRTAAQALPGSRWASEKWTSESVARTGGAVMRHESFLVMVPVSWTGYGDDETPAGPQEDVAGLFVYFNFP